MVDSQDEVHKIHAKSEALGPEMIYPPRLFPEYRQYYYATFGLDSESFMLEVLYLRE